MNKDELDAELKRLSKVYENERKSKAAVDAACEMIAGRYTIEIGNEYLCGELIDGNVQTFVCVGKTPKKGDTVVFTNRGYTLATVVVSGVDTVELRPTDMSLNGRQVFSIIHDRDADMTDNEFAQECGFEGYTELFDWARDVAGMSQWGRWNPVRAVCVRWSV